jgi:formate hydrogenlyase transcriptional activator
MVEEKTFRADLYYRLSVFPIRLPSLRERKDDIPSLVKHFVQNYSRQMGKSIDEVPDRVMEVLRSHHWPGNIRELQNFVERSVIMTHGNVLSPRISELKMLMQEPASAPTQTLSDAERAHHHRDSKRNQLGGRRTRRRRCSAWSSTDNAHLSNAKAWDLM